MSPDLPTGAGAATAPAPVTVLAGPTAVGKGTVSAAIRARYPQIWLSVSATTRAPRPGEVDGVRLGRQIARERQLLQRISRTALAIGRAEHADDVLLALEQTFEHRLTEGLLTVDDDTHLSASRCGVRRWLCS